MCREVDSSSAMAVVEIRERPTDDYVRQRKRINGACV